MCNFDLSILPIHLNLPMLTEPLPWKCKEKVKEGVASTFADIGGSYLSGVTGEFYNRFNLLTSRDYNHLYIKFHNATKLCNVLNTLQSQVFTINKKFLSFIKANRKILEDEGLLMNPSLADVKLKEASDQLRYCYLKLEKEGLKPLLSLKDLLFELVRRVQRARYESFIINIASAYDGYRFYFLAFIDFYGRIYRAGVLHFHERDLTRSLILFASDAKTPDVDYRDKAVSLRYQLACAASFKSKSFTTLDKSYNWYISNLK